MELKDKKALVVYFSHKGMNFYDGKVIELAKGNTEIAAELIAAQTGAQLFQLRTKADYPFEYKACVNQAVAEMRSGARPELAEDMDISGYDVIFLGYPNWCGTMPMCVWTFLQAHDFSGKILMPLCTNEGSGMGTSERDLARLAPQALIRPGLSIRGCKAAQSGDNIRQWIQNS